ncbi:short-chain dehydrogenase/reductase family protein [Aspergillus fumigatus Z5]|nr:short-chain dehydrogenase/reductase family protein [Aspergillus fumigatus Z5]
MTIDSDLDQNSAHSIVVESVNPDGMSLDKSGTELYNAAVAFCRYESEQQLHLHTAHHRLSIPDLHIMASAAQTQCGNRPLLATTEICAGGTYIVTGANTGLGFEAAKHLVGLEAAKVIVAVRNVSAGEKAKKDIEESTGRIGVAEVWPLDLASYDSVKTFAQKATTELDRIDAMRETAERYGIVPHLTLVTSLVGFDAKDLWDKIKDDPVNKVDGDDIPPMRT